jgi:hypothetical protein
MANGHTISFGLFNIFSSSALIPHLPDYIHGINGCHRIFALTQMDNFANPMHLYPDLECNF